MKPIYLICGVPGSGKTWVATQVADNFIYLPHDKYPIAKYGQALLAAARTGLKPVLGEVPFRISVLINELKKSGAVVKPYWVIEHQTIVKARYEAREKKRIPAQHLSRIATVRTRSREYRGPVGTSEEILKILRAEFVQTPAVSLKENVRASIIPLNSGQTEDWS